MCDKMYQWQTFWRKSLAVWGGGGEAGLFGGEASPCLPPLDRTLYLSTDMMSQCHAWFILLLQKQQFRGQWKRQDIIFLLDINKGFLICSQSDLVSAHKGQLFFSL